MSSNSSQTPSPVSRRTVIKGVGAGVVVAAAGGLVYARNRDDGSSSTVAGGAKVAGLHQLLLLSNEWCSIIDDAAERAAKLLELPYSSTTFNLDDTVALTQAQSAGAAGSKLFLTNSADGSSLRTIADQAAGEGGYLVNVGSNAPWVTPLDIGPGYAQAFAAREDIGFYEAVKYTLGEIVATFGDTATVLHVTGAKGALDDARRTASVTRALSEFPGVQLLGSLPGDWSSETGQKATEDLISRYGTPNGIIAQNDGSLTGVLAALKGLGIKAGEDVLTVGVDGSTDILRAIQSGTVTATAFQSPAYFGIQAVAHLYDALNGHEFSAPERFVGFAGFTVNSENVDGVLTRFVDNKNLPFDPRLLSHVISGDDWDPQVPLAPLKIEEFFASVPRPAGYEVPAAYTDAIQSGEFDAVTRRYAAANKIKFDDFTYAGVAG